MLIFLAAAALAAPPAGTLPGRHVALPRCSADPAAACWQDAPAYLRFAPGEGLLTDPVFARLQLAWDADGALLRVQSLPPGATVELAIGDAKRTGRISRSVAIRTDQDGITRLPIPLTLGETRDLWLNLVVTPASGGWAALPWTPSGDATPAVPASVVLVDGGGIDLDTTFSRGEDLWDLSALGASRVRIVHERAPIPMGSRGVPDPWSLDGADGLTTPPPPDTGWYTAELTWTDAAGTAVDAETWRFWHEAAAPAQPLMWPVPEGQIGDDLALVVGNTIQICGPEGPRALLEGELTRFTGVRPRSGGDCDITLKLDPKLTAEAFAIDVEDGQATVGGGDLLGLTYGALALADAIGPDGAAPTLHVHDAPAIAERPLFHSIQVANRPDLTLDAYITWIERVVLRGRYDALHLLLTNGFDWQTDSALAHPNAWTREDITRLDQTLASYGMELVPGVNAPGHAGWITKVRPDLQEDVNRELLDMRHPDTLPLLDALWTEAWTAFGSPPAIHLGHDEAIWQSERWFGDERNPRTAASPRWFVLTDELRWHLDWCRERGLTPFAWGDLFLEGWNGARDGGHHVLELLTDQESAELVILAWAPLGDPFQHFVEDHGIRVMRVHTGYLEWKREGLEALAPTLAGEGLGLFQPAPWAAFGPAAGSRPLHYHLGNTLLAGATAWDPALVRTHIEPSLSALVGHPATRPGYRGGIFDKTRATRISGDPLDGRLPAIAWPERLHTDDLSMLVDPHLARAGSPVEIQTRRTAPLADGLSLVHATLLSHDAENALRTDLRKKSSRHAAWHLEVIWTDGERQKLPVVYGLDTYSTVGDARANTMWSVADTIPLASPDAAATDEGAHDRRVYRTDWRNPRPGVPIQSWRVVVERPGVDVIVVAALARTEKR